MSAAADAVLAQLRKLPPSEQQQILEELLRSIRRPIADGESFPRVKVAGGPITSEHVAEALDDE